MLELQKGVVLTPFHFSLSKGKPVPLFGLKKGDFVAIMPAQGLDDDPSEVLEIAQVDRALTVVIFLADGRRYSAHGGYGLTADSNGCIVPATNQHREALAIKAAAAKYINGLNQPAVVD